MIREVGGLGIGGPRGKGSPSVSKGPKPPIQLLQLLKKHSRRSKRAHFVIYWVPVSTQEMELMGPEGNVPPAPHPPVSRAMQGTPASRTVVFCAYSYTAEEARRLSVLAADEIKEQSLKLVSPRVRLVVQVTINNTELA